MKDFLADVRRDIAKALAGCKCACVEKPTLDALIVVAVVDGEHYVYQNELWSDSALDAADILKVTRRLLKGPRGSI